MPLQVLSVFRETELIVNSTRFPAGVTSLKAWHSEILDRLEQLTLFAFLFFYICFAPISLLIFHFHFSIPFTIQRLSELLVDPSLHQLTAIKYARAVERVCVLSQPPRRIDSILLAVSGRANAVCPRGLAAVAH